MNNALAQTTSKEKFFRQYLELIKIFHPFNKLRPRELDVLSELMRLNNEYQNLAYRDRWKLILHYESRQAIKAKFNISDAVFNNTLSALRKKGLLVDNKVPEDYLLTIGKEFDFRIKFDIKN